MPSPKPDLRALGVEVARLRHERGLSIDRLAEAADVHRKTIIEVEAGRVAAKVSTIHGIAHALGVPLPDLVAPVCVRHPKSVGTPTELVGRGYQVGQPHVGDLYRGQAQRSQHVE